MQSVGKSSLLNRVAGKRVFPTHGDNGLNDNLLQHVTHGIDLHITKERLFLLDCQPVASASLLDEYIKTAQPVTNIAADISEPETYIYITSLQIMSFLLAMSDYVVVVSDWVLDVHLVKLLATAVMMVGNNAMRATLVWFTPALSDAEHVQVTKTLEAIFGAGTGTRGVTVINGNEEQLVATVMRVPSRRHVDGTGRVTTGHHSSEKSWLISAQRFWDTSVKKSTLYSDYARFMP
jgi:hypothetical protein